MTDIKISELPAASSVALTDEFEVNQSGTSRKATVAQLFTSPTFSGTLTYSDTGATPVFTIKSTTTGSINQASCNLQRGDQANGYAQFGLETGATNIWQFGMRPGSTDFTFRDTVGGANRITLTTAGVVTIASLAGTGSRTVVADANGVLSAP